MTERLTYKEARKLLSKKEKKLKYKNIRFEADGHSWDSKKEYNRWLVLCDMQKAGEISGLARQVRFPLHVNGIQVATYIADSVYYRTETGELVVEDVKSTRKSGKKSATATPIYQRNKRHLKAEYGIGITEWTG